MFLFHVEVVKITMVGDGIGMFFIGGSQVEFQHGAKLGLSIDGVFGSQYLAGNDQLNEALRGGK